MGIFFLYVRRLTPNGQFTPEFNLFAHLVFNFRDRQIDREGEKRSDLGSRDNVFKMC